MTTRYTELVISILREIEQGDYSAPVLMIRCLNSWPLPKDIFTINEFTDTLRNLELVNAISTSAVGRAVTKGQHYAGLKDAFLRAAGRL